MVPWISIGKDHCSLPKEACDLARVFFDIHPFLAFLAFHLASVAFAVAAGMGCDLETEAPDSDEAAALHHLFHSCRVGLDHRRSFYCTKLHRGIEQVASPGCHVDQSCSDFDLASFAEFHSPLSVISLVEVRLRICWRKRHLAEDGFEVAAVGEDVEGSIDLVGCILPYSMKRQQTHHQNYVWSIGSEECAHARTGGCWSSSRDGSRMTHE